MWGDPLPSSSVPSSPAPEAASKHLPQKLTYSFLQDLGQHPGGRGRLKAVLLRRNNLRTATRSLALAVPSLNREPGTVPPALPSQGCSAESPLGAAREWQALRFRLVLSPYHGCSPSRASSSWTAPQPPVVRAARRPRCTAGPPLALQECGPLVAGWGGASRVWGGACTSAAATGACVSSY